jgi:hypothetical protein
VAVTARTAPVRKVCAIALASVICAICVVPPCAAEESKPTAPRVPSLTNLSQASLNLLARNTNQGSTTSDAGTFFKSPKGMTVLVLIGAGFGYALYSKSHDRVKSPIRE